MLAAILAAAILAQPDDLLSRLRAMTEDEIRGVVVDTTERKTLDREELWEALSQARVIYVGETHNHPEHHRIQLEVLRALHRKNPRIAIAFEMFPRPCQRALDRYVKGKTDVETFLRESRYAQVWGYDFEFYRPLLDFAREHGLDAIALNVPQEIARKVSKEGLVSLTESERAEVASEIDLDDEKHRRRVLHELQATHPIHDEAQLERYYEGMVLWDETMAESVARYLEERDSDDVQVVVLAGRGHVEDRNGVPARVHRRNHLPFLTVLPTEAADPKKITSRDVSKRRGDFIWFTAPGPPPSLPIRGLGIEVRLEEERFVVVKVRKGGVGQVAGIRVGDKLLRFEGEIVFDPLQVDKRLHAMSVYAVPRLEVDRKGKRVTLKIRSPI